MVELAKRKNYNEFLPFKTHDVYLSFSDEGLKITVVNQKNEKSQSAVVNSSQISELSKGFIDDEDGLFTVIQEAINKPSDKIEISILENSFIISFLIEFPLKKKFLIKIELKEEKEDPMERMRKLIQRQATKIEELTRRLDMNQPIFDKSKITMVSPQFNLGCNFNAYFSISGNKKIATRNGSGNGTYYHLYTQDPLSQENSVQCFELKILSQSYPTTPYIMVGLGTDNQCRSGNVNVYSYDGTYLFNCQSGQVYKAGVARYTGLFSFSDTVIRIYYDFSKHLISFEIDGNIHSLLISKAHRNEKFFPIIMSAYNLESIEFL